MMTRLLILAVLVLSGHAYAFTSAQLVLPNISATDATQQWAFLELHCVRWTAKADVTVTRLTGGVAGTTGSTVSFGLYADADAGALLQSVTGYAAYGTPPQTITGTTSAYTITAGTKYRACTCGDGYYAAQAVPDVSTTAAVSLARILNSGLTSAVVVGLAANPCTGAAVMPATTGALTARDFPMLVEVLE